MSTKRQQKLQVSEGLALGMYMLGWEQLPRDTVRAELRFRSAWREWLHRNKFISLHGIELGKFTESQIIHTARETSHTIHFYWDERTDKIARRHENPAHTIDDMAMDIHNGIPASAWRDLAYTSFSELMPK